MVNQKRIAFGLLLLLNLKLQAQESLSLQKAQDDALINSPKIQKMKASLDKAHWNHIGHLAHFLPSVSLSAMRLIDFKYQYFDVNLGGGNSAFPAIVPSTAATLNAYWTIFDGFRNIKEFQSSKHLENSAENEYAWAQFQLNQEVKLKFYQALASKMISEVSSQNVKTLEDHLQKTKTLKHGGVSTEYDILRVEVQLSEAKTDEMGAQDNVVHTFRALHEALGVEKDERLLIGELPIPNSKLVETLEFSELQERQDILSLQEKEEASLLASTAQSRFWIPSVGLNYQYIYYNNRDNSFFNQDPYRNAWQFGFVLTWNIFDGMSSISKSHMAQADSVQAQKNTQLAKIHAPVEFDQLKKRYLTYSNIYKAKVLNVSKAQESVRLVTQSYKLGARTNSEVLDAELDLFKARAGVVSSQLSAEESLIQLENVVGRNLRRE